MIRIVIMLVFVVSTLVLPAQVVIQPGAALSTNGNVKLVFDNINVTNNDAQTDLSGSTIVVKGSGEVLLSGAAEWQVKSLWINKTAGEVLLGSAFRVADSIWLQQGLLNLNNQELTLLPTATLEGENEENHITGPDGGELIMTLTLNAPQAVNPGKLGAVISSAANLGTVTVKRGHRQRLPQSSGKNVLRYYEIIPSHNQALNATLRFYYLDAELNNLTENNLQLLSSADGSNWLPETSEGHISSNYIEKTGIPSLKLYTLAASAPLPLLWGNVQANCSNDHVALKWQTLQEQHTGHFTVQRSTDGLQWYDIGTVQAAGNAATARSYNFSDSKAPAGTLLYRLQCVDLDGSSNISSVVVVPPCMVPEVMKLHPVPAANSTTLSVYSAVAYKSVIRITDAGGRVQQQFARHIQAGSNRFVLDLTGLSAGVYYVQVAGADSAVRTVPLIKQ